MGDPVAYKAIGDAQMQARGSVFTFGGLLGELILTFTCLHDYIIQSLPPNKEFHFSEDDIEHFLATFIDN